MALETLKGVNEIGGYVIRRCQWDHPSDHFIELNDKDNALTFKIQNGPVKENGINGCQVDTLIESARLMLVGLDHKFPCLQNRNAIECLTKALNWLESRRTDRTERGVEGTGAI